MIEERNPKTKYDRRGVSADKEDVHEAVSNLSKGLFPFAFCKISEDYLTGDRQFCVAQHADGAGTKSSIAYLYWKETGDISVWRGIAQDAIVMNIDDLLCIGATNNLLYSSTIGRNKELIPGEIITEIINGSVEFFDKIRSFGIDIHYMGGETADVGDLVRTIIVDANMTCRMKRSDVISNEKIQGGEAIVGLASSGQANYEDEYNSGMGSNGLTSARHDVLDKTYAEKYPESYDPNIPSDLVYTGSKKLTDETEVEGVDIGKMILSPTRTYAPVIKKLLEIHRDKIHGMIHCTGGGQTKVLKYVNNMHIIKDHLFDVPPLFRIIAEESQTDWKEMYQVFNMGHRLEIFVDPSDVQMIIDLSGEFGIEAKVIGRCEKADKNQLTVVSSYGTFEY